MGRSLAKKIVLSRDGSVRSDAKRSRCFGGGISFNFVISAVRFFNWLLHLLLEAAKPEWAE